MRARRFFVLVSAVLLCAGAAALAGPPAHAAGCGTVTVRFGESSEVSATNITARGIGCRTARAHARSCLHGVTPRGWRVSGGATTGRVVMRHGAASIRFHLAGGGGRPGCIT